MSHLNHVDFGMLKITLHDNTSKTIPFLDDAEFVKEFILSHLLTEQNKNYTNG